MTSRPIPRRHRYRDVGTPEHIPIPTELVDMSILSAQIQAQRLGLSIAQKPTPVYTGFMPQCYPTLVPAPPLLIPLYDGYGRFVGYGMP
jgi:hypothetical protein